MKFIVTFYDDDKITILDKQEVNKGDRVTYSGKTPEKAIENGIEYTFAGWETTGNIQCVTENIELFARYETNSNIPTKEENDMYELSEANAESANLNEVLASGQKVSSTEKATRNLTLEQRRDLVNEVKDKGSVDLDKEEQQERD